MTSMLKAEDQILCVPAGVDRRGRSAQQLAEAEETTEEGFVTSVRGQTAFCRFYRPDGRLRTVANSEACNVADLMPLTRAGRGDFFVLSEALAAFNEPAEADLAAARKRAVELEHGPLHDELAAEKAIEDAACPECHGTKKVSWQGVFVCCQRCKGSGRIKADIVTVEWTAIQFSSADQPYVLTAPSPAQRRRTVNGRTFGWAGKVARFITAKAERAARAVYKALCAEVERRFEAAKQAARDLEIGNFIRRQLHAFGSDEGDEGGLRTVPLAARARASRTAEALFGKRRELRGEV